MSITDSEINAFIVAQNVKELNFVYFLSSCFVGAAAGILSLTNFAGFLFFFVSLLFSALCVSACRCVRAAQDHGDALINLRSFVCHPAHYLPDGGWWQAILLRMSSTKGGGNSLQTCNVLYYYLDYLYYIKQLDIEQ